MVQLHRECRFLWGLGLAVGAQRMNGFEVIVDADGHLPLGLLATRSLLAYYSLVDHLLELQILDLERVDLLEHMMKERVLLVGGAGSVQAVLVLRQQRVEASCPAGAEPMSAVLVQKIVAEDALAQDNALMVWASLLASAL